MASLLPTDLQSGTFSNRGRTIKSRTLSRVFRNLLGSAHGKKCPCLSVPADRSEMCMGQKQASENNHEGNCIAHAIQSRGMLDTTVHVFSLLAVRLKPSQPPQSTVFLHLFEQVLTSCFSLSSKGCSGFMIRVTLPSASISSVQLCPVAWPNGLTRSPVGDYQGSKD